MIQGILFDMDGLLFDTERMAAEADVDAAEEMGYAFPDSLKNSLMGLGAAEVKKLVCAEMGPGFAYEDFLQRVLARVTARIEAGGLPVMAGARELLAWAKAQGTPMAIASSSPTSAIRYNLEKTGLGGYFGALVGGEMVAKAKPAPDSFLMAAAALQLPPGHCLALEDSHNGMRSAAAAGCITVMVPDILPANAEMRRMSTAVLDSLHQVPEFILDFNANNPD